MTLYEPPFWAQAILCVVVWVIYGLGAVTLTTTLAKWFGWI